MFTQIIELIQRNVLHVLENLSDAVADGFSAMETHMSQIDDALSTLQQHVAGLSNVVQSATTLINGIGDRVSSAVNAALAAGVTPQQISELQQLDQALQSQAQSLADAVARNTVAQDNGPAPAGGDTATGGATGGAPTGPESGGSAASPDPSSGTTPPV